MEPSSDEIAGVVDLFGGLTRVELSEALAELAFRQEGEYDPDTFESAIEGCLDSYHLVELEETAHADDPLLVVGPVAFPALPDDAQDLPHMLDIETRAVDMSRATESAAKQFREDAEETLADGDTARIDHLVDVSYELETWGGVDLSAIRSQLDDARE